MKEALLITDPARYHDPGLTQHGRVTEPITLLVIEDDPAFADLLCEVFSFHLDLSLIGTASTISSGLRASRRLLPHAVLLDYHLSDGTGDCAASLIRQIAPAIRIIMMSADVTGVARAAAHRVGADAYIDKCGSVSRFPELVRRVVNAGPPVSNRYLP